MYPPSNIARPATAQRMRLLEWRADQALAHLWRLLGEELDEDNRNATQELGGDRVASRIRGGHT